jgi:arginine utilization protein RocB
MKDAQINSRAASARDWALWLTRQPSVTGSAGEMALPIALLKRIQATASLGEATSWLIPADDGRETRNACAALVRGNGTATVLLTGHFDTVSFEDYGELAPLATDPEALLPALVEKLSQPATAAEARARADFASGQFLPGRGLLDMKAGLAAGLAALESFAAQPRRRGNLLFVAVPDEEVNSIGARSLAQAIPALEREHDLKIVAVINLDCIGDDGDGAGARAIAEGSVGKLLLTAFAVGQQSHASHPYQGFNAGAIAAALAARMEWAPELADDSDGQPGIPPTLLSLKDSKEQYDVTTPASVFATWNSLSMGRDAVEVMRRFRAIAEDEMQRLGRDLQSRRLAVMTEAEGLPAVQVMEAQALLAEVALRPAALQRLAAHAEETAESGLSLAEQNRRVTEMAWRLSGRRGPALVLGFGSLPYPAVRLSREPGAVRLREAGRSAAAELSRLFNQSIRMVSFFPGISDMSFLGETDAADVPYIAANTPAWASGVRWSGEIARLPTVNIGPWGRDFHTPLERLHAPYAFELLPALVGEVARRVLEAP